MISPKYKVIRSRLMLPFSNKLGLSTRIEDGYILIENSCIKEAGEYSDEIGRYILSNYGNSLEIIGQNNNEPGIPCINGVLMPGFVKVHGHNHEPPIIGIAKDECLTDWLDHAVNVFTGFLNTERDKLKKIFGKAPSEITFTKALLDDIHYGITTSMNHQCNSSKYLVPEMVKSFQKVGTKLTIAVGGQDRNYDSRILDTPEEAVARLDRYNNKFGSVENLRIVPGPDQVFSNSIEMLKELKKWSIKNGTIFHMHSSEEPRTTAWFIETYGCTPVEYLSNGGILDESVILAHQVNTTQNDLRILKETNTNIVHNPLANTILGSGMPPLIEMINAGIKVAISTDGSGSADSQNILGAARLAAQYQKAFHKDASLMKSQDVLERVTVKAAEMLRINTGSLEAGKDADVLLIDLDKPNLTPTRVDNVMENLVWASDGSEVRWVISNGQIIKDDYCFTTINEKQIKEEVLRLSEFLMEYKEENSNEIVETGARGKS